VNDIDLCLPVIRLCFVIIDTSSLNLYTCTEVTVSLSFTVVLMMYVHLFFLIMPTYLNALWINLIMSKLIVSAW